MLKELEDKIVNDAKIVESIIDKRPLESKKFWALLVGIQSLLVVLLVSGVVFLHITPEIAIHAMDTIIWLDGLYIAGQGAQDVMKEFKK